MKSATGALRAYFERSWGYDPASARSEDEVKAINAAGWLADQSELEGGAPRFTPVQEAALPAGKSVYARHRSGRWYRLLAVNELSVVSSFGAKALYNAAWEGVVGIELVRDNAPGALASAPTQTEQIDLRAPFIEARYREIVLRRNIAAATFAAARLAFDRASADLEAVQSNKQACLDAAQELDRLEQALKLLARQAAGMGYTLFVEPVPEYRLVKNDKGDEVLASTSKTGPKITLRAVDESGVIGEAKDQPAQFGRLYRRTVEQRSYTPTVTVYALVGWLFPWLRPVRVPLAPVKYDVQVHVEVDTLRQPQFERIAQLRAEGFDVHVCTLTANGYETENGTPLELVMLQCEADEASRLSTVVFIPGYDFRLTGERVITGYTVFHRPVAGAAPVAFPELSVRESMDYRTAWLQTEIGELVKAVNLAPGERREITVTRSFQQETTETRSANSVFDLASSESSDLSTELERTARNETDIADKMSLSASASQNVSASGSYSAGPFSASASAGASASQSAGVSRDKTVKDVGTEMAKSAQKAARSINQSRREEVSTTSTSRTTVSTSDTSVSVIENVNQGRTLNLVFHRLYNRFVGRLYLTGLQLKVRSGTELIAGSGILPERTYTFRELREVVAALEDTPLPIRTDEKSGWELRLAILREIGNLVEGEYARLSAAWDERPPQNALTPPGLLTARQPDATPADENADRIVLPGKELSPVVDRLRALKLFSPRKTANDAATDLAKTYEELAEKLIGELAPMEIRGLPVNSTEFLVAAEGLFMDAQVGARPSTEPYFERMRDAEVAMREAEIGRVRSESARNAALSRFMGRQALGNGANSVLNARFTGDALEIELLAPLAQGNWRLEHNDRRVPGELVDAGGQLITFAFAGNAPGWAGDGDFGQLALVDAAGGARLPFVNALTEAGAH